MEYTELEIEAYTGEENEYEGLDIVEQQRSLARASRPELQREFCGLSSVPLAPGERIVYPWEKQHVQAFSRKLGIWRG